MSKNNHLKKSDKKFIRLEKARIRAGVLDLKKQEELITKLYERFFTKPKVESEKIVEPKKPDTKIEIKKEDKKMVKVSKKVSIKKPKK